MYLSRGVSFHPIRQKLSQHSLKHVTQETNCQEEQIQAPKLYNSSVTALTAQSMSGTYESPLVFGINIILSIARGRCNNTFRSGAVVFLLGRRQFSRNWYWVLLWNAHFGSVAVQR